MRWKEKVSEEKVCNLSLIEYGTAYNNFSAHHLLWLCASSFFLSYLIHVNLEHALVPSLCPNEYMLIIVPLIANLSLF